MGQELNNEANRTDECRQCPEGTYGPEKWLIDCIPCEAEFTTTIEPGASTPEECMGKSKVNRLRIEINGIRLPSVEH